MRTSRISQRSFVSGWKEIAAYLGTSVRSVQRYERELNLPVHRPAGKSGGMVITTKAELDGWIAATPTQIHRSPIVQDARNRRNRVEAAFLRIDSEIALTFASLALTSSDPEKRRRRAQAARKAYETIMQLRKNVDLSAEQNDRLDANLQKLQSELRTLG